jgi:hypothetical protein
MTAPLILPHVTAATHNASRAFYRTGDDDAVARDHARLAIVQLCRAYGLSEREVQAIRSIIVSHENGAESEYDLAKMAGRVVEERGVGT